MRQFAEVRAIRKLKPPPLCPKDSLRIDQT